MATAAAPYPNNIAYEGMGGDSTTNFVLSMQNLLGGQGQQAYGTGQTGYQAGLGALAPTMQYLTQLTKGDQADVSQAIQPEANRIRDSFAAVRNMISQQPRGGGKAGVLAEAPYKEQQQISDTAAQARAAAPGQLGQFATQLAGMGIDESQMGLGAEGASLQSALQRRQQNIQETQNNRQFAMDMLKFFV